MTRLRCTPRSALGSAVKLRSSRDGEINREAYGMEWNVALEAGGWLVSQKAQIDIRAQAIRQG